MAAARTQRVRAPTARVRAFTVQRCSAARPFDRRRGPLFGRCPWHERVGRGCPLGSRLPPACPAVRVHFCDRVRPRSRAHTRCLPLSRLFARCAGACSRHAAAAGAAGGAGGALAGALARFGAPSACTPHAQRRSVCARPRARSVGAPPARPAPRAPRAHTGRTHRHARPGADREGAAGPGGAGAGGADAGGAGRAGGGRGSGGGGGGAERGPAPGRGAGGPAPVLPARARPQVRRARHACGAHVPARRVLLSARACGSW